MTTDTGKLNAPLSAHSNAPMAVAGSANAGARRCDGCEIAARNCALRLQNKALSDCGTSESRGPNCMHKLNVQLTQVT